MFQKWKIFCLFQILLIISITLSSCSTNKSTSDKIVRKPLSVKIILDTDIGGDHDDVGAVAVLHSLANSGNAEILAMAVAETGEGARWGAPCLDAINTFYGRPDIPIGVPSHGFEYNGIVYSRQIALEFPHELDTVWDAAVLYRKILSEQPDTSVVVVTIGYLTNISNLLKTNPDKFSKLNGIELVKKKVKKWVCMGGSFPEGGSETNVTSDAPASKYAIDHWPRPVLFSGYKIGAYINSGKRLPYLKDPNPVKRAFEIATCPGCCNCSFDQATVLAAVRDPKLYWNIISKGYCSMSENPEVGTIWLTKPNKDHAYLVEKTPLPELENIIEDLMMDLPNAKKQSFFTLPVDHTINFVQGKEFGYRLPYYSYSNGNIKIEYKNLPDWISFENDSIFGVAPEMTNITEDAFQAILYDNGAFTDQASISIKLLKKTPLITDIYSAGGCSNSFRTGKLNIGDKIYVDRPYLLKRIPDYYEDCTWVLNPVNDGHRFDLGDTFITFRVNADVNVFIGYETNYIRLMPDWLQKWEETKDLIYDNSGHTFRIFKKTFPAGKIILGNNTTKTESLRLMYLILIKEHLN